MAAIRTACGVALLSLLAVSPLAARTEPSGPRQRCWGSNPNAPILIEVFSDFECPMCRQLYLETMRAVLADYAAPGKACVVYYEFPLGQHKHSRQAARYAHAAARLGPDKWVQVMDALFYFQSQWAAEGRDATGQYPVGRTVTQTELESVVSKALSPPDMKKVREGLNDPKLEAAIDQDIAEGKRRGVSATPTIFITANGQTERVPGGVQYPLLQRYLDSLLARR